MNVTPKSWSDGVAAVPMPGGEGLWIECEVIEPPSSVGRTVYVFISPEQVVPMLKELRYCATRQRSRTMSTSAAEMEVD